MTIEPQRAPGQVKMDPRRVPGASWGLLGSSGGILEALAGVLKSSRRGFGGVLERPGAVLEAFWELLGPSWGPMASHGNGAAGAFCY